MSRSIVARCAVALAMIVASDCTSTPAASTERPAASSTPVLTRAATSSPIPNASATIASGTVTVEMAEHFFSPSLVTVAVGTTVVWVVVGVQSHDVHARDHSFDSSLMAPGNTFKYTFTKPGKYPYFCQPHEGDGMFGEVDVVAN